MRGETRSDGDPSGRDQTAGERSRAAGARDAAGDERDELGHRRDAAGDERDHRSDRRDAAGNRRDRIGGRRDAAGEERDRAAEARDAEADRITGSAGDVADSGERLTRARHEARTDRELASDDRRAGASDRVSSGLDRATASGDRAAGARDRNSAELDRGTAMGDRGASALDRHHSSFDELTGVYARGAGLVELEREIAQARRSGEPFAVAFVDIVGLKVENDSHGHAGGDRLLREVADVLAAGVRTHDLVIRYGGDEFVCAFPGMSVTGAAQRFVEIQAALSNAPRRGSVTVGLAELRPGDSPEDVVARADAALYRERR